MGVLDFLHYVITILRKQNIKAMGWEPARGKSEPVMTQELPAANKVKLEKQATCQVQSAFKRGYGSTPVFLPGESQGWGSLVGCRLWGRTESDTAEVT